MKKMIFKKTALLMALVIACFACSDSYLEETNPNNPSTGSFWKTIGDLEIGLVGVYNAYKDQNILSIVDEYNRSDMTFPGWGRPNTSNVYFLQTFNNSAGTPNNKWSALYNGVFKANQVIDATENLMGTFGNPDTEEYANEILAQARGLRGLFYFYLYTGFNNGAVPILDFVPENEADFYQPISPADAVQAFYLADLEFAMENLPTKEQYNENELGRITKGAAVALLGKSYLYDGDYTTAATYFKSVIEDFNYRLTPDIGSNFTTRDEFNEESILEVAYSLNYNETYGGNNSQATSNGLNYSFSPVGGWRSLYPATWLDLLYREEPLDMNDPINTVEHVVRNSNGITQKDEDGNPIMVEERRSFSLRASASIALVDDYDSDYYQVTSAQGTNYNNAEHCYWRKYTNWDVIDNEKNISATAARSGVNVRIIRLADVYLMYAECLIKGGTDDSGVTEAMRYINKVRRRSAVVLLGADGTGEFPINQHDNVTYTASSLMDHLMYVERPLELSAEGNAIRTIDLRRWGITKQRFQELSQIQYYRGSLRFETEDEKTGTRWSSILTDSAEKLENMAPQVLLLADYTTPFNKWDNEHGPAAANYVESLHAYWPIPNSEESANPKLYDTP
jgi:starch-binding outer membrane protein, SusD/RagB family